MVFQGGAWFDAVGNLVRITVCVQPWKAAVCGLLSVLENVSEAPGVCVENLL